MSVATGLADLFNLSILLFPFQATVTKSLIYNEVDDTWLYTFYLSDWTIVDTIHEDEAIEIVDKYLNVNSKVYYYTKAIIYNTLQIIKNCDEALNIIDSKAEYLDKDYIREKTLHFTNEKHHYYLELVNRLIELWADRNWIKKIYETFCKFNEGIDY